MIQSSIGCLILGLAAATLPAQTVREKVAVEVVTVHLTARDVAGKRVEDLKASDLSLKVDGNPVAIETFSALLASGGEAASPLTGTTPAAAAAIGGTGEMPQRTMIFVDEVETHPFDRKDTCAELVRYVRAPGGAHREFRVARYDGTLQMATGWTRDVEAVAAVLNGIGAGGKAQRVPGPGTLSAELGSSDFSNTFSSSLWVSFHRDRFAVAVLEAMTAFPQTPGRNRLLVVNGGTSMMRPADLGYVQSPSLASETAIHDRSKSQLQANIEQERTRENRRFAFAVWSRAVNPGLDVLSMNDVVAKALETDVELVPVFTEGAERGDFDLSQHGFTVPTAGDSGLSAHVAAAAAMIGLANETGAEAVAVGRKAASRLNEIEGRAEYVLSFRDPKGDHTPHKISLSCRRPGVTIEYRRGYRIPEEEERVLDTVIAGFLEPERRADPMNVAIRQSPTTDSKRRAATKLEIAYAPPLETGASDERPLSFVAVGQDRNGDRTEPIEWSGTAEREEGEDAFGTNILLNVPPDYAWSVAIRDQPTGLISYVVVPAPAKP